MTGFARKAVLASALAIAAMAPTSARAQWAVAEVGGALMQHIMTQVNTYTQTGQDYAEYAEQAKRWYDTYTHYQQQLVRVQGMVNSFSRPPSKRLTEVPEDYLVADRCGGAFSLSGALHNMMPTRSGDFIAQQRSICQQLQVTKNQQFNETVKFLNSSVPEMERDMRTLLSRRNSSNSNGNVDAATADATRIHAKLNSEIESFKASMQGYDHHIANLNRAQSQLAEMALKGERNPLGTLVKTSALKAALEIDN